MLRFTNILLVNPWEQELYPPPGLGYLQAVVRHYFQGRVKVTACNLNLLESFLKMEKYDLVGVSFHSFSVKQAQRIRSLVPGHLICGGHHPSALPEQMLSIGYNQVVIGPGEDALIDIIEGKEDPIVKKEKSRYTIDELPFPDYDGLGSFTEFPIISSRGCPFDCSFCASTLFWKRKWEGRNPQNILCEIQHRRQSGMVSWMFEDDNFTLKKDRLLSFCELLQESGSKERWQCASRAETLADSEVCDALKNSGCVRVWIGVESLSQETLDRVQKNTSVEKIVTGLETARIHGLGTFSQFIVGLPGDGLSNILETVVNIKKYQITSMGSNIAWVLPGTEIHKEAKKRGFNDEEYLHSGAPYYHHEQGMDTLIKWNQILTKQLQSCVS